ncbi:MAG TPA: DNA methyltransferase [Armatimonadetes bacterium]|nr:DNA methyltransferase [Armatimonadota bacterium]
MRLPFAELAELGGSVNTLQPEDRAIHRWYNFVLAFPPHLVREYISRFGVGTDARVLDPFSGTGTTPVECKKSGIASAGIEAIPMSHFAGTVKTTWDVEPEGLLDYASKVAIQAEEHIERDAGAWPYRNGAGLRTLPSQKMKLLITNSISPKPLHKALILIDCIEQAFDDRYSEHATLALASVLPTEVGNLRFGPEVGVGAIREDSDVVNVWFDEVRGMSDDLRLVSERHETEAIIYCGDARRPELLLADESIDAVITSPPYPNEKDYSRIVRLESVLLGYMDDQTTLRRTKKGLLRSNTRNIYKGDQDHACVADHESIQRVAQEIEDRRIELGKTSGFERMYHRAVLLYFGGMKRHLAGLRGALRSGAKLAYVVGDQASYLRVMIRTGQLLAEVADSLGYEVEGIDLFRTRLATATKEQLREEVLLLRWPGGGATRG